MKAAVEVELLHLDESQFSIVPGKTRLTRVLDAQNKFEEAGATFQEVIVRNSYNKGLRSKMGTPDHVMAVWYYAGPC